MIVESIRLEKFRNYRFLELKFDSGTNIFYGDNAQGKTNLIESIYICGTTKSHKGSKDREIIQFEEEEAHICMKLRKNNSPVKIDMHLKKNKPKGIAINGIPIRKASELFGIANFVFFSPEDLNIIKNGPAVRRHFLDMELCQLNKVYLHHLSNYNKVIDQRNKILKEYYFRPDVADTLDIWDMQLEEYGKKVIEERRNFIRRLNDIIPGIHSQLTGSKEKILLTYEENIAAELFGETLQKNREKDLKMKTSLTGPHRDDICFRVNGVDIRKFGSQGQQRTAALSLKLSEIELVKREIGDTPILLLDDVLSELDSSRQHYLLDSIHDIQTFITCTGLDDFVQNRFHINKVFHVVEGQIFQKDETQFY